jgi:hypothetical protein
MAFEIAGYAVNNEFWFLLLYIIVECKYDCVNAECYIEWMEVDFMILLLPVLMQGWFGCL